MLCVIAADFLLPPLPFPAAMSFPQLGYQYIRPIYPPERQGIASNARAGTELSPSGALSNVLSTMYGSPFAAAAQGYGAFLPYSNDISIFNQLVSHFWPPFEVFDRTFLLLLLFFLYCFAIQMKINEQFRKRRLSVNFLSDVVKAERGRGGGSICKSKVVKK